jgi:hypothetical protein
MEIPALAGRRAPVSGVFISYRRDDTSGYAGRLHDKLSSAFGDAEIFMDIEGIEPGVDFVNAIEEAVRSCSAIIVVIGRQWLTMADATGRRRLDDPEDYPSLEVATALDRGIVVIPVLVQGASMPAASELPERLSRLSRMNALELSDARWDYDCDRLIKRLAQATGTAPRTATAGATAPPGGGATTKANPLDQLPIPRLAVLAIALAFPLVAVLLAIALLTHNNPSPTANPYDPNALNIKAPDVKGKTVTDAIAALKSAGFAEDMTNVQWTTSSAPRGRVTDTTPGAGQQVPKGSVALIMASMGQIAFVSKRDGTEEILTMDADGSHQNNLGKNRAVGNDPGWSPDESHIVFDSVRDTGKPQIYVMKADGSQQKRITRNGATDAIPKWSPDGKKIVFTSNRDGHYHLYLMNTDGTSQTRLGSGGAFDDSYPSWSPDGKQIAFQTNRDGHFEVYVMYADGTGQQRLTSTTAANYQPAWSPNGKSIAFTSERDGPAQIYVMTSGGGNQTSYSNNTQDSDAQPTWGPDNLSQYGTIAFCTGRDNQLEIYTMAYLGTSQTNITQNQADDCRPAW